VIRVQVNRLAESWQSSELAVDHTGAVVSSPRRSTPGFGTVSPNYVVSNLHHPARSGPPRWEALHADSYDRHQRLMLVRNHQSAVHMSTSRHLSPHVLLCFATMRQGGLQWRAHTPQLSAQTSPCDALAAHVPSMVSHL
jgi:hypothetical protein